MARVVAEGSSEQPRYLSYPQINLADSKKCQDLFDKIEAKCLSGKLTSIGKETG